MPNHDKELLVVLASQAGLHGHVKTSTAKLALLLGSSQQTISRKLRDLKKFGLIDLTAEPSGCLISLTKEGAEYLRDEFLVLKRLFETKKKQKVVGEVKGGIGEGKYYVSRPFYLSQFKKLLGFKPFFGTLNLVVDPEKLDSFIFGLPVINIPGFKTEERTFGRIHAYKVVVEGKQVGAMIFPERTTHPRNEVELIASINLRKKFKLKEGDKVSFEAI